MVVLGRNVVPLLKETGKEISSDNVLGLSAQLAYYFFFSLFPLMLFLTPLVGLIGDERENFELIMRQLATVVPRSAYDMLYGVVADIVFEPSAPGLMSIGALLALWAGSNIFNAMIDALNRAFDVTERRTWWKKRLVAVAAVIASGAIVLTATVVMLFGSQLVDWVGRLVGLDGTARVVWMVLQYLLAFVLLVALASGIYYFLPNVRHQDRSHVLVGAVVATVLWIVVTLAFRSYVQNFGNYNKTYGTIGGVIVMLTWMYLTMLVLLSGGELVAELHHGTAAVEPQRGATYAGRIGSGGASRSSTERIARVTPMTARGREGSR
jgi:membrane protein